MNDLYNLMFVIGLSLGFVCLFFCSLLWIKDEKKLTRITFFLGLFFIALGIFGDLNYIDYPTKAKYQCYDLGYADYHQQGNSFYCLSFGDEPRITRLNLEVK